MKTLRILGIRGIPAAHGGFETFAERLALYLTERGWKVVVYCQLDGKGYMSTDIWQGIERINIPISRGGPLGTIIFDWRATRHAAAAPGLCLTLGYNTAIFCAEFRLRGIFNVINMDGIEWSRAKWGWGAKLWFWLNERAGCWLGNHLIADHPEIKKHLTEISRKVEISTIAYGADFVTNAPSEILDAYDLQADRYLTVVARPEPENSIFEIVAGFSRHVRGMKLAVLGNYDPENPYHRAVQNVASHEVKFLGAIYDKSVLAAIRFHSYAYVHGHQVGGTNPSLVEALGAGNAVIAHDNRFNRWVSGEGALYFHDAQSFSGILDDILERPEMVDKMRKASRLRFNDGLTWPQILSSYETLLSGFLNG